MVIDKKYFQCFSLPLKEFLENKKIKSEFKAKHCKTNREFWLYLYSESNQLEKALEEWSIIRKQQ